MKVWRRGGLLWAAAALALVAIGASVVAHAAVRRGGGASGLVVEAQSPATAASSGRTLADPQAPAFEVPAPVALGSSRHESTWAVVRTGGAARAAPSRRARIVARVRPRTPEGTANIVLVLERARDAEGGLWLRVHLAVLPNDTTGWVPRWALGGYGVVRTHLVVDLGERRATLFRDGRIVFRAPVGIGTARFPTPRGRFYVRNKLTRYRNPFYGPIAFGTSARSATLTDWPAGGFVGIHGTNRPRLIPGRVSHGCIRLRNAAILRLARLLPIGTPLTIHA
jgi:lipoprotein-anchoring transpeptidase ErfK/SrfK